MEIKTYRLEGVIELLSPLSHIGESHGPDSYLATEYIIGPDGKPVEVFVYSGNAFRGMLRDHGAKYLLDRLGKVKLPLDVFYMLFSGGSIGGDQEINIEQARLYRKVLPIFSIFGGGVGNQIIEGKMHVGAMYPLTKECQRLLPQDLRDPEAPSWRHWIIEKSFTRMDDAKSEELREYIQLPEQELLAIEGEVSLFEEKKPKKEKKENPQQMRYTIELMAAGAKFYQRIDLLELTELELGAFVSAMNEFAKAPYIGGQNRAGMGLIKGEWHYTIPGEKKEKELFIAIGDDSRLYLSEPAAEAKQRYDAFVFDLYNQYLENKAEELKAIVGGTI